MNQPLLPTDSPPPPDGITVERETIGTSHLAPQRSLSSGFGDVMKRERALQAATEMFLGADHGLHSSAIDRILREQYTRLGANIAILEQRYETEPATSRDRALQASRPPAAVGGNRAIERAKHGGLRELAVQHQSLLASVERLLADGSDGQRGALILTEVAHNHEEMAWMLTALLRDGLGTCDVLPISIDATLGGTGSTTVGKPQP
jgi:hypothetical protein